MNRAYTSFRMKPPNQLVNTDARQHVKPLHIGALVCFAGAIACYALTWIPGLIGFGFIGVVFEIVGWANLFSQQREKRE